MNFSKDIYDVKMYTKVQNEMHWWGLAGVGKDLGDISRVCVSNSVKFKKKAMFF